MGVIDDTLGTNIFGENSSDRARKAQKEGANKTLQVQREMYDQQRQDQMPWMEAGKNAIGDLTSQMGDLNKSFSMADFQADPGYAFRLAEGQKAIERSAAARGGLNSGATMKALAGYQQGMASDEFNNAYNRFNNDRNQRFSKLSSLAGFGQNAAGALQNASTNYGAQAGSTYTGLGNAQAASHIAQGNRFSNLLGQGLTAWGLKK